MATYQHDPDAELGEYCNMLEAARDRLEAAIGMTDEQINEILGVSLEEFLAKRERFVQDKMIKLKHELKEERERNQVLEKRELTIQAKSTHVGRAATASSSSSSVAAAGRAASKKKKL